MGLVFWQISLPLTYCPGCANVKPDTLSLQFTADHSEQIPSSICFVATTSWKIESCILQSQQNQPDPCNGPDALCQIQFAAAFSSGPTLPSDLPSWHELDLHLSPPALVVAHHGKRHTKLSQSAWSVPKIEHPQNPLLVCSVLCLHPAQPVQVSPNLPFICPMLCNNCLIPYSCLLILQSISEELQEKMYFCGPSSLTVYNVFLVIFGVSQWPRFPQLPVWCMCVWASPQSYKNCCYFLLGDSCLFACCMILNRAVHNKPSGDNWVELLFYSSRKQERRERGGQVWSRGGKWGELSCKGNFISPWTETGAKQ